MPPLPTGSPSMNVPLAVSANRLPVYDRATCCLCQQAPRLWSCHMLPLPTGSPSMIVPHAASANRLPIYDHHMHRLPRGSYVVKWTVLCTGSRGLSLHSYYTFCQCVTAYNTSSDFPAYGAQIEFLEFSYQPHNLLWFFSFIHVLLSHDPLHNDIFMPHF
jgi:hypothetical protein